MQALWWGQIVTNFHHKPSPEEAIAELERLGVNFGSDSVSDPQLGSSFSRADYPAALRDSADEKTDGIIPLWSSLCDLLCKNLTRRTASLGSSRMFLCSVETAVSMAIKTPIADESKRCVQGALDVCDASCASAHHAAEVASLVSKISLQEYMVARLGYKYFLSACVGGQKFASTLDGPYGRLDLPMGDRVVPWKDIEESIMGDSDAKKSQLRYKTWTENYNQPGFRQGFYWRDLSAAPYLIDEAKNESPYKYREYLWRHLG
jgi:hypothetical protein